MKRIISYVLLFLLIFCVSFKVEAKTLKDLKNELAAYEREMNAVQNKTQMTKDEINNVNARVRTIRATIEKDQENIKKTEEEIVVLEAKADEKKEEKTDTNEAYDFALAEASDVYVAECLEF